MELSRAIVFPWTAVCLYALDDICVIFSENSEDVSF